MIKIKPDGKGAWILLNGPLGAKLVCVTITFPSDESRITGKPTVNIKLQHVDHTFEVVKKVEIEWV